MIDPSPCALGGTEWLPVCIRAFHTHTQAQAYGRERDALASPSKKERIMNCSQGTQANSSKLEFGSC